MTIWSAIATIISCTVLFIIIGAGAGYALGTFVPGYYRTVVRGGLEPGFDPVSVGLGLGLTQGMVGGVVVGLAIVAVLCWRESRLQRAAVQDSRQGSEPQWTSPQWWLPFGL